MDFSKEFMEENPNQKQINTPHTKNKKTFVLKRVRPQINPNLYFETRI